MTGCEMSLPCPLTICRSLENSLGSGRPNPDRLVQRAVAEPAQPRLPGSRAFSIGSWMPRRGQAGKPDPRDSPALVLSLAVLVSPTRTRRPHGCVPQLDRKIEGKTEIRLRQEVSVPPIVIEQRFGDCGVLFEYLCPCQLAGCTWLSLLAELRGIGYNCSQSFGNSRRDLSMSVAWKARL